jgi:BirA family biotin operon repressor/biotin-[acetyl-CoA-carboxylase] ligase
MGKANRYGNWWVERVPETGSTNADLLVAAESGAPDRSVLVTDHQTAGRGRLGRVWQAPPGANLLVSFLHRDVVDHPHRLTQRLGLAAVRVLRQRFAIDAGLKWPNDVVARVGASAAAKDVKVAGILAQSIPATDGALHVVVGMGLNVAWAPSPDVAEATCVNDVKPPTSPTLEPFDFLMLVLDQLDELAMSTPEEVSAEYRSVLRTLGRSVNCDMPDDTRITGRAVDVDDDGRLLVVDECALTHRIDTADVVHLRNA